LQRQAGKRFGRHPESPIGVLVLPTQLIDFPKKVGEIGLGGTLAPMVESLKQTGGTAFVLVGDGPALRKGNLRRGLEPGRTVFEVQAERPKVVVILPAFKRCAEGWPPIVPEV
jgi:hypothetical protein